MSDELRTYAVEFGPHLEMPEDWPWSRMRFRLTKAEANELGIILMQYAQRHRPDFKLDDIQVP